MEWLTSPLVKHFDSLFAECGNRCLICSPFVKQWAVDRFLDRLPSPRNLRLEVLTNLSIDALLSGATEVTAVASLVDRVREGTVVHLPGLHAKVYVAESQTAIMGSCNFTHGGLISNYECGVRVDDRHSILKLQDDLAAYASLGALLSINDLRQLESDIVDLKATIASETESVPDEVKQRKQKLQDKLERRFLRLRTTHETVHAIFADTILYVLRDGPMKTTEMHQHIASIHPDLCDDTMDRVIDGQHFGKLWKHQVRTAQQHLKKKGKIAYDNTEKKWYLTADETVGS
ncbi:MAG: phospholipase D-like domain-containing protein [Armatimonadota bacterium]